MKKKYVVMMLAVSMLALSACGKQDNVSNQCTCTCEGCADCIYKTEGTQTSVAVENAESVFAQESVPASEAVPVEGTQTQESTEIPSTEEVTYKFNDKTMTVTAEYKLNQMIDSEGNSTEVWYKEYIKNVELSGYTCKIIK